MNCNPTINQLINSIRTSIQNNEHVIIGGNVFTPNELIEITKSITNMNDTLQAARLLCANLERGGVGHQTLVDNFRILDDSI